MPQLLVTYNNIRLRINAIFHTFILKLILQSVVAIVILYLFLTYSKILLFYNLLISTKQVNHINLLSHLSITYVFLPAVPLEPAVGVLFVNPATLLPHLQAPPTLGLVGVHRLVVLGGGYLQRHTCNTLINYNT